MKISQRTIHLSELLNRINGDRTKLVQLLQISLIEFPKWENSLNEAISQQNFNNIERLAHTYKGSCATLTMDDASSIFLEMEKFSRSENIHGVEKKFNEARDKIGSASVIIKDYIQKFPQNA